MVAQFCSISANFPINLNLNKVLYVLIQKCSAIVSQPWVAPKSKPDCGVWQMYMRYFVRKCSCTPGKGCVILRYGPDMGVTYNPNFLQSLNIL